MVGEIAIHATEHGYHFTAQFFKQQGSHLAGGTVTRVHHDLQRHGNGYVLGDFVDVGGNNVFLDHPAITLAELALDNAIADVIDATGMNGLLVEHDFQTIVSLRIVAASNHQAGATVEVTGGEVKYRGWNQADIDDIPPGLHQRSHQCGVQGGAGIAPVAAHQQRLLLHFTRQGADGEADL